MSSFLFVVPPLVGHITPLVAVGRRLDAAGHTVIWCGEPTLIRSLAGPAVVVAPAAPRPATSNDWQHLRGYAAVRYLWEDFLVPLAGATVDAVTTAARQHRIDVVVSDMQALAGPLAAARLGLPWATSATTSAPLRDSFTATPKIRAWMDGLFTDLIERAGGAARRLTPRELEMSPHLVLAFTTRELVGGPAPAQVRYVGPALTTRPPSGPPFPPSLLDGRPLVVIALGTVNAAVTGRFLAACAAGLALFKGRVQAVVADPLRVLGDGTPPDILTHPYPPMLELLPRAVAVVCHGGHNTVCESLAHGVPLVVAPIRDDQPVIADQVAAVGAGVRLRFGRATPEIIHDAVHTVLTNPGFREAARAVKASFDAAGSATAAADHLTELARASAGTGGARRGTSPAPVT